MGKEKISYRKAVYRAIERSLSENGKTVFLGEDITDYGGAFGVAGDLHAKFPERVIAAPISEGSFTGVAAGLAMTGYRVIVEIMFMDFMTLALDTLVNHAANVHYMYGGQLTCPIVIRTPAGGYRGYGPSHSKAIEAMLVGVPGIKIFAPSTAGDAYGCFLSVMKEENPVVFVEHKLLYNTEEIIDLETVEPVPFGKARIAKAGTDVTIVSHSYGTALSLEAANELMEEGINAEVIDLRSLKPFDIDTVISSVKKTGRMVCAEEGNLTGGIGAEVASSVIENALPYLDGRVMRVGRSDVPIPASTIAERFVLPDKEDIKKAVKRSLSWK